MKSRAHGSFGSLSSVRTLGLVGALALGGAASLAACLSPGKLDCEEVDCGGGTGGDQQGGTGGGNSGGSGGGGSGGAGGNAGGAGGGNAGGVTAETAIMGCDAANTVGKFETDILVAKCATMTACHKKGTVFGDYSSPEAWKRFIDKPGSSYTKCKLADPADVTKSLLLIKVKEAMPKCAGEDAGSQMPPATAAVKLTTAEAACFDGYVKAITGK